MIVKYKEILIKKSAYHIYTEGLQKFIDAELRLAIGKCEDEDYIAVIKYIIDYIVDDRPTISENQSIGYYSWFLQFIVNDSAYFDIYEAEVNGDGLSIGCDYAISVIKAQSELCTYYGLIPSFPNFNQMIVISKGVYEGKDIEGIRYDSPNHMSGWWLITDDYDDNINSLMTVHYSHIAFNRPDILKFLALPFGYRFLIENNEFEIMKDVE